MRLDAAAAALPAAAAAAYHVRRTFQTYFQEYLSCFAIRTLCNMQ